MSVIFKRPQRLNRKKDPDGLIPHTGKPDLDNVIKSILDGMNGRTYKDDSQVCSFGECAKYYSEKDGKPRVEVDIFILQQPTTKGK
jgi:Holliday junction resolvase RusA-like endonuclease|tara:strand:- start:21547 stop:21804 length:258 start_codon:yes stop_codon:yes gene_type:complete